MKTINDIRIESKIPIFRKTALNTLVYNEEYVEWLESTVLNNYKYSVLPKIQKPGIG